MIKTCENPCPIRGKAVSLHCEAAQHSTAQHSTAQHSTAQHSTAQITVKGERRKGERRFSVRRFFPVLTPRPPLPLGEGEKRPPLLSGKGLEM
ncbi:MAG: hypothetical protein LBF39_00165, partial [Prevotellaceae bacterium]|nr:hypothetical protein [Prevotellaceae bacterium]